MNFSVTSLSVRYGDRQALSDVSLEFPAGKIHALLGENGAGKTTLANALAGLLPPSSGSASAPGAVGYVHQHFAIPPGLTSAECLELQDESFRILTRRKLRLRFAQVEERTGLPLGDPDAEAATLAVGSRQRLEFAREVSRNPDLLILDEPTAALAPPEIESFGASVRRLAARGTAILFITHKLSEVFDLAETITVLRQGHVVLSRPAAETTPGEIAASFLAGVDSEIATALPAAPGEPALEIHGLSVLKEDGSPALDRLSLTVRKGEITAIVGVDGNGQDELAEAVAGLRKASAGEIFLFGRKLPRGGFRASGGALVPADRQRQGLILDFSVEENLRLREPPVDLAQGEAEEAIAHYSIQTRGPKEKVRFLSGGNQQKVLLARELRGQPRFLLAVNPSSGLDLAATHATRTAILDCRGGGAGVLLVTSSVEEAHSTADSIFVIFRGRLSGPFPANASDALLGRKMAGLE